MLLPLLQGISFAIAPLLSFGPFKIFVLSSALNQGWRRTLPLATVPLVADIPVILLIWVVLQQVPEWSVNGLRAVGGFFYIYLAIRLYRGARETLAPDLLDQEVKRSYWQAVLAVWISPAVYVSWSVIGVPAMLGFSQASVSYVVAFLVGFYALWVGGLALEIFLVGKAGQVLETRSVYLVYAGAALLVVFGIYQIAVGLSNLLGGAAL